MPINLSDPIWTIHHVAAALGLAVDTAREYTYRPDFPAPKDGLASNLWLREDVLAWFAALPVRARRRQSATSAARPKPRAANLASSSLPATAHATRAPGATGAAVRAYRERSR